MEGLYLVRVSKEAGNSKPHNRPIFILPPIVYPSKGNTADNPQPRVSQCDFFLKAVQYSAFLYCIFTKLKMPRKLTFCCTRQKH